MEEVHPGAAKTVTGGTIDAEQGDDVTGTCPLDLFHLVGVHPYQTADLGFFTGTGVDDGIALLNNPLIGTDVGQLTVTAVLELEGQGNKRIIGIVAHRDLGLVLIQVEGGILDIGGTGAGRRRPHPEAAAHLYSYRRSPS